jgi:hypothetical protein
MSAVRCAAARGLLPLFMPREAPARRHTSPKRKREGARPNASLLQLDLQPHPTEAQARMPTAGQGCTSTGPRPLARASGSCGSPPPGRGMAGAGPTPSPGASGEGGAACGSALVTLRPTPPNPPGSSLPPTCNVGTAAPQALPHRSRLSSRRRCARDEKPPNRTSHSEHSFTAEFDDEDRPTSNVPGLPSYSSPRHRLTRSQRRRRPSNSAKRSANAQQKSTPAKPCRFKLRSTRRTRRGFPPPQRRPPSPSSPRQTVPQPQMVRRRLVRGMPLEQPEIRPDSVGLARSDERATARSIKSHGLSGTPSGRPPCRDGSCVVPAHPLSKLIRITLWLLRHYRDCL